MNKTKIFGFKTKTSLTESSLLLFGTSPKTYHLLSSTPDKRMSNLF